MTTPVDFSMVVPTTAFGRRFRSTTEARWATCLTSLGVAWEYESETYDLGPLGWYLPDFWLPSVSGGTFLEVKPGTPRVADADYDKARALHIATRSPVLIALGYGVPPVQELHDYISGSSSVGRTSSEFAGSMYDVIIFAKDDSGIASAGAGGRGHYFVPCIHGDVGLSFLGGGWHCGIAGCRTDWERFQQAYEAGASFRPDGR